MHIPLSEEDKKKHTKVLSVFGPEHPPGQHQNVAGKMGVWKRLVSFGTKWKKKTNIQYTGEVQRNWFYYSKSENT